MSMTLSVCLCSGVCVCQLMLTVWLYFVQLKALEEDAVIAAYVMSHDGRTWKKMWYQVKRDFVLYKFRAHEVCVVTLYPIENTW